MPQKNTTQVRVYNDVHIPAKIEAIHREMTLTDFTTHALKYCLDNDIEFSGGVGLIGQSPEILGLDNRNETNER